MRNTRRLIKIPIGVYLLFILLLYNTYDFLHRKDSGKWTDDAEGESQKPKFYVFTTIREVDFLSTHHKMFRRQFRHLYEENEETNVYYRETFLDMNGYLKDKASFEYGFKDSIFTDNAPQQFLTELGEYKSN